jgi:protein kinase C substrate 80K-H
MACPDKFSSKPEVCAIGEELKGILSSLEAAKTYSRDSAATARSNSRRVETELAVVKQDLDDKLSFAKEIDELQEHFYFLELKNQCFNAVDGKFTYKLCVMNNIQQSDSENGAGVNLGNYKSLTELDDGTFEMKFENGQYCHAFGPRSASVKVACGASNVLKEAAEPSTCFYTFKFESPVACSVKYGKLNNLL